MIFWIKLNIVDQSFTMGTTQVDAWAGGAGTAAHCNDISLLSSSYTHITDDGVTILGRDQVTILSDIVGVEMKYFWFT